MNTKRYKEVCDLLRTGKSTPELEAEYELLKREYDSRPRVDVTRRCWEADAREMAR